MRILAPRKVGQSKGRKASRFSALRGTRKSGMSTDEIMHQLRGFGDDVGTELQEVQFASRNGS